MSKKGLSKRDIIHACQVVSLAASASSSNHCLIGGALFKILGVKLDGKEYETPDIDIAASSDLKAGLLQPVNDPRVFSWNKNGHYDLFGIKIDYIHKLSDGTSKLFMAAVQNRLLYRDQETGLSIWLAPINYAAAIRLAAGRKKDLRMFWRFVENKVIEPKAVCRLVQQYAPLSKGAAVARAVLGVKEPFLDLRKEYNKILSRTKKKI